jgi:hypothetical protein
VRANEDTAGINGNLKKGAESRASFSRDRAIR